MFIVFILIVDAALKTIEERNSPEKLVPCRVSNDLVIREGEEGEEGEEEEEVEDNESSLQNKAKIAEQIRKASLQTGKFVVSIWLGGGGGGGVINMTISKFKCPFTYE